jgi:hypothetical protein
MGKIAYFALQESQKCPYTEQFGVTAGPIIFQLLQNPPFMDGHYLENQ